jgi:hypothetical protein
MNPLWIGLVVLFAAGLFALGFILTGAIQLFAIAGVVAVVGSAIMSAEGQ